MSFCKKGFVGLKCSNMAWAASFGCILLSMLFKIADKSIDGFKMRL